jgi:type IV pilus assembly protein PilX
MKSPQKFRLAIFHSWLSPASHGVSVQLSSLTARPANQRGVVLFLTLIALLAMSLAAVALIRSIDTSTLIAGNLAFKQAATSSGGTEIENALTWLKNTDTASGANVYMDAGHPLNSDSPSTGYYSYLEKDAYGNERSLTDTSAALHFDWQSGTDSSVATTDSGGNERRYIIQRMCRLKDTRVSDNECLFGGSEVDKKNGKEIPMVGDICDGPGCPLFLGEVPQYRITVQIRGPRHSVSYVQAFAY